MREIGFFTKDAAGIFEGIIKTFAFTAALKVIPVVDAGGKNTASHDVLSEGARVGEARPVSQGVGGYTYLVRLDDPCLPGPLEALLAPDLQRSGYSFTWIRGESRPKGLRLVKG